MYSTFSVNVSVHISSNFLRNMNDIIQVPIHGKLTSSKSELAFRKSLEKFAQRNLETLFVFK